MKPYKLIIVGDSKIPQDEFLTDIESVYINHTDSDFLDRKNISESINNAIIQHQVNYTVILIVNLKPHLILHTSHCITKSKMNSEDRMIIAKQFCNKIIDTVKKHQDLKVIFHNFHTTQQFKRCNTGHDCPIEQAASSNYIKNMELQTYLHKIAKTNKNVNIATPERIIRRVIMDLTGDLEKLNSLLGPSKKQARQKLYERVINKYGDQLEVKAEYIKNFLYHNTRAQKMASKRNYSTNRKTTERNRSVSNSPTPRKRRPLSPKHPTGYRSNSPRQKPIQQIRKEEPSRQARQRRARSTTIASQGSASHAPTFSKPRYNTPQSPTYRSVSSASSRDSSVILDHVSVKSPIEKKRKVIEYSPPISPIAGTSTQNLKNVTNSKDDSSCLQLNITEEEKFEDIENDEKLSKAEDFYIKSEANLIESMEMLGKLTKKQEELNKLITKTEKSEKKLKQTLEKITEGATNYKTQIDKLADELLNYDKRVKDDIQKEEQRLSKLKENFEKMIDTHLQIIRTDKNLNNKIEKVVVEKNNLLKNQILEKMENSLNTIFNTNVNNTNNTNTSEEYNSYDELPRVEEVLPSNFLQSDEQIESETLETVNPSVLHE